MRPTDPTMPLARPATALPARPDSLLRTTVTGLLVCLGVGIFLTGLSGGRELGPNLLYSTCIGMSCFAFIEGGRRLVARRVWRHDPAQVHNRWPGWPWMLVIIAVGSVAGYTLGAALGNAVGSRRLPMPWQFDGGSSSIGSLTISLAAGLIATYLFSLRGRLAATQARAEAAQRVAAETRLKLLESQLEPHMLFNTLANLRALITADPLRAQQMLDSLIAFLRSTLAASRTGLHPLAAEFERSADYLALMQIRLGERLQVELALPPELAALPVPALLMQPLVENAIRHGIEPARAGGRLALRAERHGEHLVLTVRDSGVGLGAAAAQDGGGFGTAQVRERLATLYGDAAALDIDAAEGGGTLARIRLPIDTR